MCENLSLPLVSTTFQSLVITSTHSIGRVLRIYRGSEGALDKNYTHNINLNHWPIRYISMPLHIIAGRRRNTNADPNPRVPRNWPQDASIQQGAGASWRETWRRPEKNMAAPTNKDGGAH